MRSSEAVGKFAGLLRGRELRGLEDAAVHLADERHGVCHALVPAGVPPCALTSLTTGLQIFITPNVMNVVKATNLREVPSEGFVLCATVGETAGPVVAPLDHRARLETVGPNLINVAGRAGLSIGPEAERQQVL